MLDFRITTFLTLCKTLSYTRTANILHITQPAVTQHIQFLEKTYGTKFFSYHNKTLRLTKEGEIFFHLATTMQVDNERIHVVLAAAGETKTLSFGATLTIGEYTMPSILASYLKAFPNINISMLVDNTQILLSLLQSGKIDFAFIEGLFQGKLYDFLSFAAQRFIPVCAPQHAFAKQSIPFDQLLSQRLFVREHGSGTRSILEIELSERNLSVQNFSAVTEIGSLNVIKQLVKQNLGITFLYEEAVRQEIADNTICEISVSDFQVSHDFSFVFLKSTMYRQEYLKFYDYCQTQYFK